MTTVLNPLAYNGIGTRFCYWFLLGTRNRIHYGTLLAEMQKAAIREDPGSIREEKRQGETAQKPFPSKHRNPGRSGKFPGRETGREKPTIKKPAVREDSGKVSGKSNNKGKGAGTGIKNGRHIYIYIYIYIVYIYIYIYIYTNIYIYIYVCI